MTDNNVQVSEDYWWKQRCAVLYEAWVQLRYHKRRQRFFDLADKMTRAMTVVLGASLLGKYLVEWIGAGITALGLLALVFGYGERRQLHTRLAELAGELIASVEAIPAAQLNAEQVAQWRIQWTQLCINAPPALKTLTLMCAREQSIADGYPEHVPKQSAWRRLLADFKS